MESTTINSYIQAAQSRLIFNALEELTDEQKVLAVDILVAIQNSRNDFEKLIAITPIIKKLA